jgi:hypothetical protein
VAGDPFDSLDVPVAPVGSGRRSKRSWAAIVVVAGVAAGWLGLTVLASRVANEPPAAARATAPATIGPSTVATPGASVAPSRRPGPELPVIANVALPGAPAPVFVVRDGTDARFVAWRPGSPGVEDVDRFPGAFGGTFGSPPGTPSETPDGGMLAWLSPDRTALLVSRLRSASIEGSDTASLATSTGIAWQQDGITALGGVAWSPDGSRAVLAERRDRWLIVERGDTWTAREIDLSAVAPPAPSRPTGGDFALSNQVVPAGFSQSGDWVIGAILGPPAATWTPIVRVRVTDGRVEPISSFPIGGPDGLAVDPSLIADPATGRTVGYGPNGNIPGGPPQLEVRDPDGSYAYGVRTGIVISWLWTGDGRIVVLGADGYPFPSRWTLQLVDRDGKPRTLLEAPRATAGAMFGIEGGYAGLILNGADQSRRQVIVVRLDDGATSAVTVDAFGSDGPVGAGWLP